MSYQELPVQMHPRYEEFKAYIDGLETDARKNPNALELAFNVWLNTKEQVYQLAKLQKLKINQIESLKNDLDRLHRERDSFQEQARVMAECVVNDVIINYAIWQAISDLERVCRHRTATVNEDWLQIESEDMTTKPVVEAALIALEAANIEMRRREKFPNILIVYDRSKNKFFGKS